jgi:hypothetical protein
VKHFLYIYIYIHTHTYETYINKFKNIFTFTSRYRMVAYADQFGTKIKVKFK